MTTHSRSRRAVAASITLLLLTPLSLLVTTTAADAHPVAGSVAGAAEPAAGASASDFLFYKFPLPLCAGVGLNVTPAPYFSREDCGFVSFTLSGTATTLQAKLFAEGSDTAFATLDPVEDDQVPGDYQVDLAPDAGWPSGAVTLRVVADGETAGETTFGHNLLAVELDEIGGTSAPGDPIPVSGTVVELENDGPTDTTDTGVPATFTLRTTRPDGSPVDTQAVTADSDGTFAATIPGSATVGIAAGPDQDFRTALGVEALDATYGDPATGEWSASRGGATSATVLSAPTTLLLENSFVSSVGWVKPGQSYPSRLFVTNATDQTFDNVTVTVPSPDGATFTQARAGVGAGTAVVSGGTVTWDIGTVPAAGAAGPAVVSAVLESEADTLVEDAQLVWKDISSTATLSVGGSDVDTERSHGPRVIPQDEGYDTARYGDRPFPVVPVDYLERKHQDSNSGHELSEAINASSKDGSTFNLFQEMSLGQLFPNGTVPSAGIATADFTYDEGFSFSSPDPAGTCHGTTLPDAAGTPLYSERIVDGFYQLPGTTDYYGDDTYGSAIVPAVDPTGATGSLFDIDSACGPAGKLVLDAATIADPEIDYSDYDTDKDGVVDFFMVVFAGCGGNGASQVPGNCPYSSDSYDNVWPHSSSLESYYTDPETGLPGFATDDQLKDLEGRPLYWTDTTYTEKTTTATPYKVFVRIGPYNVNPETAIDKASVISHEYGHSLGLPDFYSTGGRETYGDWNLMATDKSQNMDVFSRQELGWVVPEVLSPGETRVDGWTDSKQDTHTVHWRTADGTPYTLTGPDVHNSQAYVAKLPGRQLIDPAKFDSGDKASKSHAWWSGSGNDFGCSPTAGHNLDLAVPGLKDLPAGSTVTLELKSLFDVEWDYDYGYVLTSTDGGDTYTSHASTRSTPTTSTTNPNANGCQAKYGNGITGSSASYTDPLTVQTDRVTSSYPDATFIADSFDISDLAGADQGVLRFSYATDPGLARPGWFIDDVVVTATTPSGDKVLLRTDMESAGGADDPRFFNGGCRAGVTVAKQCTKGWRYVDSSSDSPQDHSYYLEMRDRSGFDLDGNDQIDRDPIGFAPGLSLVYTDEAHGYGNAGTDDPPAQSPLDSTPQPGNETPNLDDAAFTAAGGKSRFTDSGEGHTDNYTDPAQSDVDERYPGVDNPWRFQYDCLTFDVTGMSGDALGPQTADGDLTGDVTFDLGPGCGTFDYGYADEAAAGPPNAAPDAAASATPNPATVGQRVTLDARGSSDSDTAAQDLDYVWDFGNGGSTKDAAGSVAAVTYTSPGTHTARVTVTDPQGASDTATVDVVVTGTDAGPGANTAPVAEATASPRRVQAGDTVLLSGSGSTDAEDPGALRYAWDFDDGGSPRDAAGERVRTSFSEAGVYDVTLTVTDPGGVSSSDSVRVRVARKVACDHDRVEQGGSWRTARSDGARGGRYCDNLGRGSGKDTLALSFTGPRLALRYARARAGGVAKVVVDGVTVGKVHFDSDSRRPEFGPYRSFGGLGDGRHTARLVMLRGTGYVDDFVIWGRLLR